MSIGRERSLTGSGEVVDATCVALFAVEQWWIWFDNDRYLFCFCIFSVEDVVCNQMQDGSAYSNINRVNGIYLCFYIRKTGSNLSHDSRHERFRWVRVTASNGVCPVAKPQVSGRGQCLSGLIFCLLNTLKIKGDCWGAWLADFLFLIDDRWNFWPEDDMPDRVKTPLKNNGSGQYIFLCFRSAQYATLKYMAIDPSMLQVRLRGSPTMAE